jgi:hypothetical protein
LPLEFRPNWEFQILDRNPLEIGIAYGCLPITLHQTRKGEKTMLLIILLLVLIFGFGFGGYRMGPGYGYYDGGGISLILTVVLILLLLKVI